jgi:hypothetical protein
MAAGYNTKAIVPCPAGEERATTIETKNFPIGEGLSGTTLRLFCVQQETLPLTIRMGCLGQPIVRAAQSERTAS